VGDDIFDANAVIENLSTLRGASEPNKMLQAGLALTRFGHAIKQDNTVPSENSAGKPSLGVHVRGRAIEAVLNKLTMDAFIAKGVANGTIQQNFAPVEE